MTLRALERCERRIPAVPGSGTGAELGVPRASGSQKPQPRYLSVPSTLRCSRDLRVPTYLVQIGNFGSKPCPVSHRGQGNNPVNSALLELKPSEPGFILKCNHLVDSAVLGLALRRSRSLGRSLTKPIN